MSIAPSTLKCPVCPDQTLETLSASIGSFERCPECRGLFISQEIVIAASLDRAQCALVLDEPKSLLLPTEKGCPKCMQKLRDGRVRSRGLILTLCPTCRVLWTTLTLLRQLDEAIEKTLMVQIDLAINDSPARRPALVDGSPVAPTKADAGLGHFFRAFARTLDRMADRFSRHPAAPFPSSAPVATPKSEKPAKAPLILDAQPLPPLEKPTEPLQAPAIEVPEFIFPKGTVMEEKPALEEKPAPEEKPVVVPEPVQPVIPAPKPVPPKKREGLLATFKAAWSPTPKKPKVKAPPTPVKRITSVEPLFPSSEPSVPVETPAPVPAAAAPPVPEPVAPILPPEPEVPPLVVPEPPVVQVAPAPEPAPVPIAEPPLVSSPPPAEEPAPTGPDWRSMMTDFEPAKSKKGLFDFLKPKPRPKEASKPKVSKPGLPTPLTPKIKPIKTAEPEPKRVPTPAPMATPEPSPAPEVPAVKPAPKAKPQPLPKVKREKKPKEPMDRVAVWAPRLGLWIAFGASALREFGFEWEAAIVCAVIGWSLGYMVKLVRLYPFSSFRSRTLQDLEAEAASKRAIPVTLQGQMAPVREEDPKSELVFKQVERTLVLNRFRGWDLMARLFGLTNPRQLPKGEVTLKGWYRGGLPPFVEVSSIRGESVFRKSAVRSLRWALAIGVFVLFVIILFALE